MNKRCAMTDRPMNGPADGIGDDGEWIGWVWINEQLHEQALRARYSEASSELCAEITFGIQRHKPRMQGSDGRLGNDSIDIKTITPEQRAKKVTLKRKGNVNQLLVVKITEDFEFEARMLDRNSRAKGQGKLAVCLVFNEAGTPSKCDLNNDLWPVAVRMPA